MDTELGPQIATGRTSDIHSWGTGRIAKVFTGVVDDAAIDKEAHDSALAYTLGLTPIECHGRLLLPDGRSAIIFDRLDGEALTTVAERRPYRLLAVARTLARAHAAVHAASSDAFPDVRDVAADLLDAAPLARLNAADRAALRSRIHALPAGNSVLHLDFHPLNVFVHHASTTSATATATIDWQSSASGHPAADVASTCILFTEAELFPGISAAQKLLYQSVRRVMLRGYLKEYRSITGVRPAEIDEWMTAARILRLGWLDVPSERDTLIGRIRADIGGRP